MNRPFNSVLCRLGAIETDPYSFGKILRHHKRKVALENRIFVARNLGRNFRNSTSPVSSDLWVFSVRQRRIDEVPAFC